MADVERSSDVQEDLSVRGMFAAIGSVVTLGIAIALFSYGARPVGIVLAVIGTGLLGFAVFEFVKANQVSAFKLKCPYCSTENAFVREPDKDWACRQCARMVPYENGQILPVHQVRCGFCNHLNYWSVRSFGLICEECSREIPISGLEGGHHRIDQFAVKDDDHTYDLVLTGVQRNSEELIGVLQHMLALNRNQVKQIIAEAPAVLLSGIPKKKAELLAAQIKAHHASADIREHTSQ